MGCDIHMVAEHRKDGRWTRVLPPEHAWDPWLVEQNWLDDARQEWFHNRNYALFGVLAGVRGDGPPIAEPRGLPGDVGEEVRAMIDNDGRDSDVYWLGDHSFSWLTLDEILAYDWDRPAGYYSDGRPMREWCSEFLTRTVPALQDLDPDPRNVRLVFGFDS